MVDNTSSTISYRKIHGRLSPTVLRTVECMIRMTKSTIVFLFNRFFDEVLIEPLRGLSTRRTALQSLRSHKDSLSSPHQEQRDALSKLEKIVGLADVKEFVRSLHAQLSIDMQRRLKGIQAGSSGQALHMVFTGSPGTGKTTVARVIAELLRSLGLLRKGHLIEADRSSLVAGYSGQTALKTKAVVESALGGVLFIDEAYSLVQSDGRDSFGNEALDTLIKMTEDHRGNLVVILAGYVVVVFLSYYLVLCSSRVRKTSPHVV